jgi:hypothetical protein
MRKASVQAREQLPRRGLTDQGGLSRSSGWTSRDHGGGLYDGVRDPSNSHHSSVGLSDVCTDGSHGPGLGVGIRAYLAGLKSRLFRPQGFVQGKGNSNGSLNLQLVSTVPQFPTGPGMAPGSDGVLRLDHLRDVDSLSDKAVTVMPLSLLLKLIPLAGIAGGFLSFIEGSRAVDILFNIAGSSAFVALVSLIRWLIGRRDKVQEKLLARGRTDAQLDLEREKLVDSQFVALLKQWEDFYERRDKERLTLIELLKATVEQRDDSIRHRDETIAQLSAAIDKRPA